VKKILTVLVVVAAAILFRAAYRGDLDFSPTAQIPAIPDVDNGDGTISYTLVDKHLDPRTMKPIAYTSWVLRFPKSLKITRPGAIATSVSGGGVEFSTKGNPNSAIYFFVKWPSWEDANPVKYVSGSGGVPVDRSVINFAIEEAQRPGTRENYDALAMKVDCKWTATEVPNIYKPGVSPDSEVCFVVGNNPNLLLDGNTFLAVTDCRDTAKSCDFRFYYDDRSIHGTIAIELLPQFKDIRLKILGFIKSASVSETRVELFKQGKPQ
jgi:hypothetical protein